MVAGVSIWGRKLRPVVTKPVESPVEGDGGSSPSTTPTAKEARIAETRPCPPAPRKRRSARWNYDHAVAREYLSVPDLESVFVVRRQVESANRGVFQ
uniref:Uncharacterized protein n=1 Tax=Kalanchoe fedtschenkoi TaxID=63787 RepID=A0A7N0VE81_KALFE